MQRFNSLGSPLGAFGVRGSGEGEFNGPAGVALLPDNKLVVFDVNNHRVQEFRVDGSFVTQWGSAGTGPGQFGEGVYGGGMPGIAVSKNNLVYVVDSSNHRVQVFTLTGGYVTQWGGRGSGAGQLDSPSGIAADTDGSIWVVDSFNDRIKHFGGLGEDLGGFDVGREMSRPFAIAVAPDGTLYVGDSSARIQRYAAGGTAIGAAYRGPGPGHGQGRWVYGLAFSPSGRLYVADVPVEAFDQASHSSWRGEYYSNRWLSGPVTVVREDEELNFDWGLDAPDPVLPADNFSVLWQRVLWAEAPGTYKFSLGWEGAVRMSIDSDLVTDTGDRLQPGYSGVGFTYDLSAGPHVVEVALRAGEEQAGAAATWQSPIEILYASQSAGNWDVWVMNDDGSNVRRLGGTAGNDVEPALAPDGQTVVFVSDVSGANHIYLMDADGTNVRQVTYGSWENQPTWSPDSMRIAYNGGDRIWVQRVDQSSGVTLTGGFDGQPAWSPDGTRIAYAHWDGVTDWDIYTVPAEGGTGSRVPFFSGAVAEVAPAWARGGDTLAFEVLGTSSSIYQGAASGGGVRLMTSAIDARSPSWSPTGARLIFYSTIEGNYQVQVLDVASGRIERLSSGGPGEWGAEFGVGRRTP